jgi:hypothetical protein
LHLLRTPFVAPAPLTNGRLDNPAGLFILRLKNPSPAGFAGEVSCQAGFLVLPYHTELCKVEAFPEHG